MSFRGRHVGYIFQTHHLLPGFTAMENVLLGMSFTGRTPDKAVGRATCWMRSASASARTTDRRNCRWANSNAWRSRGHWPTGRASCWPMSRPGALDEKNAQQVLDLVRKLCSEVNACAAMLVSHDLNIARQLPRVLTLAEINRVARN